MRVGVIGINYKSSDLSLREKVALAAAHLFEEETDEVERLNALLLSTCNRTEIYFSVDDLAEGHSEILQLLRMRITSPFEHALYSYFGEDCFLHLALVTSGLDSVVLGETEIQGQVKACYQNSSVYRKLPSVLHFLFQKCLKIGKEARSCFPSFSNLPTLEETIFSFGEKFIDFDSSPVLFIGNSEINRKILTFFKKMGKKDLALCTRSISSAKEWADKLGVRLICWSEQSTWHDYPFVICGTNRSGYLLSASELQDLPTLKTRLILDLSVPRNVDPKISRHPNVTLLNLEEIGAILCKKRGTDWHERERAKERISYLVERQQLIFRDKLKISMAGEAREGNHIADILHTSDEQR